MVVETQKVKSKNLNQDKEIEVLFVETMKHGVVLSIKQKLINFVMKLKIIMPVIILGMKSSMLMTKDLGV